MKHAEKIRKARRMKSRHERQKGVPLFRSKAWRWRNAEHTGRLFDAREAMQRKELAPRGFFRMMWLRAKRFAWNALQAPKRAACAVIGHKTTLPLRGFRDQYWCFRCERIVSKALAAQPI